LWLLRFRGLVFIMHQAMEIAVLATFSTGGLLEVVMGKKKVLEEKQAKGYRKDSSWWSN